MTHLEGLTIFFTISPSRTHGLPDKSAILDFAKGAFFEAFFEFHGQRRFKEGSKKGLKKERRPIANRQLLYQSSLLPHFLPHGATVTVKLWLRLRMVAGTRAKRTLKIPRFGYKGFFLCGINALHTIFSNLNLFWNKYSWTFSLEWENFRHPFIQHTADIFKPLCWRIYIRYHFIFQAQQVFFYEITCHVLYLILFICYEYFWTFCVKIFCFISYLQRTFFKTFFWRIFVTHSFFVIPNTRTFLGEKYAPRFI